MTLEEFVYIGHTKGLVHDTLNDYPEEIMLVGTFDILMDMLIKVTVVERTVDNIAATAYWRDPDPDATIQNGYVSIPI